LPPLLHQFISNQTAPTEPSTLSLPDALPISIVDPGVGTARRPVAIETASGRWLVAPDNGLLCPAWEAGGGVVRAVVRSHQPPPRSEEHTSELQSRGHLVCRLLLEKKKGRRLG